MRRFSLTAPPDAPGAVLHRSSPRWPWWPARRRSSPTTAAPTTASRSSRARACRAASRRPRNGPCADPSLAPELTWQTTGLVSPLCYHGGSVLPGNETYVLTWDPNRNYWATTRQYVEQFLSDVAAAERKLQLAVRGHAAVHDGQRDRSCRRMSRLFAGGCIDYGTSPGNQRAATRASSAPTTRAGRATTIRPTDCPVVR